MARSGKGSSNHKRKVTDLDDNRNYAQKSSRKTQKETRENAKKIHKDVKKNKR